MHLKKSFFVIIGLFYVNTYTIGNIPQYEIDEQKKCIDSYLKKLKIKQPTKESLAFTKERNGDSMLARINYISKNYKKVNNYDSLEEYCNSMHWCYGTVMEFEYLHLCLNSKLPIISNLELKECKELGDFSQIDYNDTKIDSKCKLYYLYKELLEDNSLVNADRYPELLDKIKGDEYLSFVAKFGKILNRSTFKKIDSISMIIQYINDMNKESLNKLFTFNTGYVSMLSVYYQEKYENYLSLKNTKPLSSDVDSIYTELTSYEVQTFINNLVQIADKKEYNVSKMHAILKLTENK